MCKNFSPLDAYANFNCFSFFSHFRSLQGINPTIKVWELELSPGNESSNVAGTIIAEFSGHKYAVNCVVSK